MNLDHAIDVGQRYLDSEMGTRPRNFEIALRTLLDHARAERDPETGERLDVEQMRHELSATRHGWAEVHTALESAETASGIPVSTDRSMTERIMRLQLNSHTAEDIRIAGQDGYDEGYNAAVLRERAEDDDRRADVLGETFVAGWKQLNESSREDLRVGLRRVLTWLDGAS